MSVTCSAPSSNRICRAGGQVARGRRRVGPAGTEPIFESTVHPRSPGWPSGRPSAIGLPPLARYATLQCGDGTANGRLHRGEPRLQAPLPPLSDRAGLRRPLPRRAGRRRDGGHRAQVAPAPQHITFGDPDFFNGPRTPMAIVAALHARVPRRHLRRDDQGRAPAAASRPSAAAARHRLRVRDHRGRVVRRRRARAAREGTHARGLRRGRRALSRGSA